MGRSNIGRQADGHAPAPPARHRHDLSQPHRRPALRHPGAADILVVAVGRAKFVTADMVKPGAVVIDVGMNRDENGKLCGDVDFAEVAEVAGAITPGCPAASAP